MLLRFVIPLLASCLPLQAQGYTGTEQPPAVLGSAAPPQIDCQQRTAEDFVPMTRSERLAYAIHRTIGPSAFFVSGIRAGLNQGLERPEEWNQGSLGFGKRFGSVYAQHFIGSAIENGAAFGLHEDNRYFASGKERIWERLFYAGESTLLERHDDGSRSVSLSVLGGLAGASFLSRSWQPRSESSAEDAMISFGLSLAVRAGMNVAREFSPAVLRRVLP